MELKEKVNYWVEYAKYDLKSAEVMNDSARYLYTVFMCQQAIEKILKALYLQTNEQEAPKTHNLEHLANIIDHLGLSESDVDLLEDLTAFYINGRYPSYKKNLAEQLDKESASSLLVRAKELFACLEKLIVK